MADNTGLRRLIFKLTGRYERPSFSYLVEKALKYTLLFPPVYARAKFREAISHQPPIDGKRFVFVCGLHRSGTSVIHRAIRNHPHVSGIKNTSVPEDEGQHLQTVFRPDSSFGPLFAFHPEVHLTEDSPLVTDQNRLKLVREWARYMDFRKPILVEKSPSNIVRTRFLQAIFPASVFVIVARHPIIAALAVKKWTDAGIARLIEHWLHAHQILLQDSAHLRHCTFVRYEDFAAAPNETLAKIGGVLDLEFPPTQEKVFDANRRYFANWEEDPAVDVAELHELQQRYAKVLDAFDYSLFPPYVRERDVETTG